VADITEPNIPALYNRIIDLTGQKIVDAINDKDAIGQWLLDGCYDVVRVMIKTPEAERFVQSASVADSGSVVVSMDEIHELVRVERDGYDCRYVSPNKTKELGTATSIYYPRDADPVFNITDGSLMVYPTLPGGGAAAKYYFIPKYQITNWDTSTTTIADFPIKYNEHIVLYAAIKVFQRRSMELISNTPDNVNTINLPVEPTPPTIPDIMATLVDYPKAPTFEAPGLSVNIGSTGPSGPLYYLETEEDPELVTSSLSIVEKELSLFDKRMELAKQKYDTETKDWEAQKELFNKRTDMLEAHQERKLKKYNAEQTDYDKALTLYTSELTKYREHLAAETKRFDNAMLKVKNEYEWLQAQIALYQKTYNDKLGLQTQAPKQ